MKGGVRIIKNNCKGCTIRYIGCHANCESYIGYSKECERIRENRRKFTLFRTYVAQKSYPRNK